MEVVARSRSEAATQRPTFLLFSHGLAVSGGFVVATLVLHSEWPTPHFYLKESLGFFGFLK